VKVTRLPVGAVKRLTAAVVVNHRKIVEKAEAGKDGKAGAKEKVTMAPLAKEELEQINNLVKEAMGFQPARNDSLNVVNAAFTAVEREPVAETPIWKQPDTIAMARDTGSGLVLALLALLVFFGVLRPAVRALNVVPADATPALPAPAEHASLPAPQRQDRAAGVKALAQQDPKVVANVVKSWVGNE
jgi:flagellar M-ring protein FliF